MSAIKEETATQRWERLAIENRECRKCQYCAWEPDADLYCAHPEAFKHVSNYGASFGAMERAGLCHSPDKKLWKLRNGR